MITTPVYVKMDAEDPLLLSKGLCRQVGVVIYHSNVWTRGKSDNQDSANVPIIRVKLVELLRLLPLPECTDLCEARRQSRPVWSYLAGIQSGASEG